MTGKYPPREIGSPQGVLYIRGSTVTVPDDVEVGELDGTLWLSCPHRSGYAAVLPGIDQDLVRAEMARTGRRIVLYEQIWIGPPDIADRIDRKEGLGLFRR